MTGFMENPIVLTDAERVELNQRAASRSWRADDFKGIRAGQHFSEGQVRPLSNHRKGNTALQV